MSEKSFGAYIHDENGKEAENIPNDTKKLTKSENTGGDELKGLSREEVSSSRERYGSNALSEVKGQSFFKKLLGEFSDPIIKILLGALVITVIIPGGEGGSLDAVGIAIAVLLATVVSTLCEYGSEKAFRKMQAEAAAQSCTVVREGETLEIPLSEAVVGDIAVLRSGESVPADGILIEGAISCDQSALNGESKGIYKIAVSSDKMSNSATAGKLTDKHSLFRGSTVTAGNGKMRITAVGDNTYYGNMASELQSDGGSSPLKIKLTKLAKTLSKFGYFCAFVVGLSDLLFHTVFSSEFIFEFTSFASAFLHSLTLAVSVVVMAVPEGLPMMITVVLSSNMLRMQKEHVMVRKLVGIETAGSVDILFTDKTGTLTYGKPKVTGYVYSVDQVQKLKDVAPPIKELISLTASFAVSSTREKRSVYGRGSKAVGGDITDRAIMDAAWKSFEGVRRTEFFPFNSTDKLCAATVEIESSSVLWKSYGDHITLVKGAPELLLERCEHILLADGSRNKIDRTALKRTLATLASSGTRVLAAVYCYAPLGEVSRQAALASEQAQTSIDKMVYDATFISFICIRDELRLQAKEAIGELKEAGIQTVMITGDNALTAEAIAREAGILPPLSGTSGKSNISRYAVMLGSEISAMSDQRLAEILPELRVVARALPQDKSRLVRVSKARGHVVAMTGDGLNDAPALKLADVGFAMGSGTEVAKEAGDIVITDNNIASIVSAVLYGRTIFRSIRKFIVFQLTMNLCAVGISIIAPFIGYETPITVMQMLWINIIIDTLAALAFAGEAPMRSYMKEAPTPREEAVLSADMMTKIFTLGVYTLMLCVYFLISPRTAELFGNNDEKAILTGLFSLFIFSGIIGSLNARSNRINIFAGLAENPVFAAVMCGVFTIQSAMIFYGGKIFDTVPLSGRQLRYILMLSLTVVVFGRIFEVVRRIGRLENSGRTQQVRILRNRKDCS